MYIYDMYKIYMIIYICTYTEKYKDRQTQVIDYMQMDVDRHIEDIFIFILIYLY